LVDLGLAARGAEPRGALAWEAARIGTQVEVADGSACLDAVAPAGLAGLILTSIVDRSPAMDQLDLLARATDRLAAGAPLVVVSSDPETAAATWSPVAADLVPGRPFHAETWQFLLERAGYRDVRPLTPDPAPSTPGAARVGTYAVVGVRPS
jgi:hypothetical protein